MIDKLSIHIIQALLLSTGVTFSLLSVLKLAQVSTQMKFNAIIKYNFLGMPILLISLLSIFITIFSVNYYDTSSVDICKCLNNASYYNSNEKDCDKSINSKLGHNWKTTNYSQEPDKNAKFEALANKCK